MMGVPQYQESTNYNIYYRKTTTAPPSHNVNKVCAKKKMEGASITGPDNGYTVSSKGF